VSGSTVTYLTYAGFNAVGQPLGSANGNDVTTTYQYIPQNNRLLSIRTSSGSGTQYLNLTYDYTAVGNVKTITDAINPSRTQSFLYDDLNRITQDTSASFGAEPLTYTYNEIGNILSKEGIDYDQYGQNAGPHAVTHTSDGKTYTYDPNGNMISDSVRTITYDYDNMPISVKQGSATTR
jgi:YD repeat-containing protein